MTLVVCICRTDFPPYMFSDTLVSSSSWQTVSFPTQPSDPSFELSKVAGLTQKIVEIRPGLFFGWAGDYLVAARYIVFLRTISKKTGFSAEMLRTEVDVYFKIMHPNDGRSLQFLTILQQGREFTVYSWGADVLRQHPDLGTVWAIGTGAQEFSSYLDNNDVLPKHGVVTSGCPPDLDQIDYMMKFVHSTMFAQQNNGFGLADEWGGGFEILLSQNPDTLSKLNNILYLTYVWDADDDVHISSYGKRYFQYSIAGQMNILTQIKGGRIQRHIVAPPDATLQSGEKPVVIWSSKIQMAVILLINRHTSRHRTTMLWNENGHAWCGIELSRSVGYSIRVNTDFIRRMIKSYIPN